MKPGKPLREITAMSRCKLITLITTSIVLLVLSAVPLIVDPVMECAKYSFRIAKGSLVYDILSKEVPGALVEAYIFNITNGDKFVTGEDQKLKLEEVGPFTYQEFRYHEDFSVDEEAGTMSYKPRIITRFHPEYSIADPKSINVTVANIPLLTMGSTMGKYPTWTQMAFNVLVSRLDAKAIFNLRANDFLWGYDEPLISLGNKLMPGWINFDKLGLMDRLYDQTVMDALVVGASNTDKFRIKTVNGYGGINHRGYSDPEKRTHCNTFVDTYEGLAYPSGLTPETQLRLYRNVFCRILDLQYTGTTAMDFGPKAFLYRFSNTTFRKNSENDCLCGSVCVDGLTDLSKCFYGFEVSFSQAHFYDVDPKIYERIEGMKPNFEEHGSEIIVDPNLGSVLKTRMTLQLNLVVQNADSNTRTKPFSRMIIPVLYFKIVQPDLADDVKMAFRNVYVVFPYIIRVIQVILFIIAVALLTWLVRPVLFMGLCKKTLVFSKKKKEISRPGPIQRPLIEKNSKFTVELITNTPTVDRIGVA